MQMECCAPNAECRLETSACPRCRAVGHEVGRETVGAMAALEVRGVVLAQPAFRFCETPACEVVYYANDAVVERAQVRVQVHVKDPGLDVPFCYCFGHTRRDAFLDLDRRRSRRRHRACARAGVDRRQVPPHSIPRGGKEVNTDMKSVSLCPSCDACPNVEIDEREVRIGEEGNLVKLTPSEWNVLVRLIKSGELREV
jgi:hypothetical protein